MVETAAEKAGGGHLRFLLDPLFWGALCKIFPSYCFGSRIRYATCHHHHHHSHQRCIVAKRGPAVVQKAFMSPLLPFMPVVIIIVKINAFLSKCIIFICTVDHYYQNDPIWSWFSLLCSLFATVSGCKQWAFMFEGNWGGEGRMVVDEGGLNQISICRSFVPLNA